MTEELKRTLCEAWEQLDSGKWPESVLGKIPNCVNRNIAILNAMKSIEDIVGKAEISRYIYVEHHGGFPDEWLRWYTVSKYRYYEKAQESKRINGIMSAIIATILTAILVGIALCLL